MSDLTPPPVPSPATPDRSTPSAAATTSTAAVWPATTTAATDRRRELLVGDADRDLVCRQLAQHYSAGRLTADELDERVNRAVRARTDLDLHRIQEDLPRLEQAPCPTPTIAAPMPEPSSGVTLVRVMADIAGVGITAMAILCTLLVLMVPGGGPGGLIAFGTAVSTLGSVHYAGRIRRWLEQQARPSGRADRRAIGAHVG